MNKKLKVKEVVKYGGHSLSANGSVNLTFKGDYSELVNTIQVMQMLNCDVTIKARVPGQKPMQLGMFRIKAISVSGDGSSSLKFNGLSDYIEMDNLNLLPLKSDDDNLFAIMMEAEIEDEDSEEDGE